MDTENEATPDVLNSNAIKIALDNISSMQLKKKSET